MTEAQASTQAVFDELVRSAGYLFSDLTAFLRQRKNRTVIICAANDVDSACAAHMLQHFLIDVLGLFVRLTFINHYSDIGILAVNHDDSTAAWICINCCSRQYVPRIVQHVTQTAPDKHDCLFCLIDQNRPIDQNYIIQAMVALTERGPNSSRCHIYLTEDDFKATKIAVYDTQVADLFKFDVKVPPMSRLTQSLIIDVNGEYTGDCASLVALAAISEHQADTAVDVMACAVSLASLLSLGQLSVNRYMETVERLKKFHKVENLGTFTFINDIYVPLLKLQPLSATLKSAILQLGDTLTVDPADLNAIRTELELTTKQWDEIPAPNILSDHKEKITSVLKRYVISGNGLIEIPVISLKTSAGILNNLDLAILFGYNLVNPLTSRRSSTDEGAVLDGLKSRLNCLVEANASTMTLLEILTWLGRPSTPQRQLEKMFANARTAQEESVKVISRLMLHRRGSVFGLRGTLEGFLEENAPECLLNDYALSRICFALSRLITKDGGDEELAHILLLMSSDKSAALIKGYLAFADHTRTNRMGMGLIEVLKDRLGSDTFEQDFLNASLVCVASDIARKSFHSLFPRKRVRCSSFQPDDEQPREKRNRRSST